MKYFLIVFLLFTSCKGSTEYGECVGFAEEKDPTLTYEVSVRNAFWSIIGFETIIAPILWATDFVYCPSGKKK